MESIKDRVAIVGMGCVKFGENWGQSLDDMIVDAAYEAFEDAGIGPEDIQAAWWGSVFAGHTGQILATPLKLGYIPVTHVENACATGSEAVRNAAYAVAAGIYDVVLAVGAEKLKDTGYSGLPQTRPVATWSYRLTTQTPAAGFAMMATAYFAKYGLDYDEGKRPPRADRRQEPPQRVAQPQGALPARDHAGAGRQRADDRLAARALRLLRRERRRGGRHHHPGRPGEEASGRTPSTSRPRRSARGRARAGSARPTTWPTWRRRGAAARPPTGRRASRIRARRSASPRCTTASPSPSSRSWRTCSSARAAG